MKKNTFKSLLAYCLDCKPWLAIFLLLQAVLRIPNFFEPYWYGDEAIYLTIGNSLRNGALLYGQIVDHKTPLIYYFAALGSQLNFRILFISWMLVTTMLFYFFSTKLFKNLTSTLLATLLFVVFTTLPWFEGNIPNGELFVAGFVLLGFSLISLTSYFRRLTDDELTRATISNWLLIFAAGFSFGLAILTKVPAVLDFAAAVTIFWFTITHSFFTIKKKHVLLQTLWVTVRETVTLLMGMFTAIALSLLYFYSRGTLSDYVEFGLLYNFHYTSNWNLGFSSAVLQAAFTLQGKFVIAASIILYLTLLAKKISPQLKFIGSWVALALFASLLSNRPYPHYFLQVIPPLALLLGSLLERNKLRFKMIQIVVVTGLLFLFISVLLTLHVGFYPTVSYYQKSWRLLTGEISWVSYRNSFNSLMADNYAAAKIITASPDRYFFIWGTNPTLYALTGKQPTGRFTVTFHITDLNAYDETYFDLVTRKPEYIAVMIEETAVLPGLDELLRKEYIPNNSFDHFILWRKRTLSTL